MTPLTVTKSQRVFAPIASEVGISILRRHPEQGTTFLIRMRKGARAPRHDHAGGEETFVIEGTLRICDCVNGARQPEPDIAISAGDYAFVPPGETHEGIAEEDCVFFVVAPGGVTRSPSDGSP